MSKTPKIVTIAIALCVFGFLLTICDFMALHDIHNEYVSVHILNHLNIKLSGELPEWTATKGEWDVVRISYLFRFAFFIFCAVVLYELVNRLRTKQD